MLSWLGQIAAQEGARLYLVGGIVRDKLSGKGTLDIDLACEGDVKRLGERLSKELGADFIYYPPFKTGTIEGPKGTRIDLAMSRRESYPVPGELPKVRKASIEEDLYRRDFTVNAIAESLHPDDFGELIDPMGGQKDLKKGVIRILHDASFADDPTRIFRAVRYAARLGFRIEPHTLKLLKEAVGRIPALSGERLLYELRCIMNEPKDVRLVIVKRLDKLGVLAFLGPKITPLSYARLARIQSEESCEFLCLVFSHFKESYISKLPISKACVKTVSTLRQRKGIMRRLNGLSRPSGIYFLLKRFDERGLRILSETERSKNRAKIAEYLANYRNVTIQTTGDDLKELGIKPGPRYQELLDKLLAAKLDGKIRTKRDEQAFLKRWTE